jgi:NADH dehydrogenase
MAGLAAVRALVRMPCRVTVIDAHNYTTFPPLLFQVATCFLAPTDVTHPVRGLIRRHREVHFRLGRVIDIDWAHRQVLLEDGSEVGFDYLVLAGGVTAAVDRIPGAGEHAIPLKSVNDATRLRNRLLRSFEAAAADPAAATAAATGVAVVGGGSTGVELSGYVANFLFHQQFAADYPQLDPASMRVTLLEQGDRLLPGFHPALSAYALRLLRSRGVDVRLGTAVETITGDAVTLRSGERIPAATVVYAAGVEAPRWVRRPGVALDRGRLVVDADLRLPGHPDTFAVGDLAAVASSNGALYPQLAQVAIQSGRHAAHQIGRLTSGQRTEPFRYFDKGMMAIIGRNAAVVQMRRLRLTGRIAWLAWGFLHLGYLPGTVNRASTGLKYLWWHLTHENVHRVLLETEQDKTPPL